MVDWKKLLPGSEDSSTIHRLRELEKEAGALPILSALFFHEGLKSLALFFNIPIPTFIRMFMLSILFGGAYVYHEKRYRAWQKAKEQAQKQTSKLDQSQSNMSDFTNDENKNNTQDN